MNVQHIGYFVIMQCDWFRVCTLCTFEQKNKKTKCINIQCSHTWMKCGNMIICSMCIRQLFRQNNNHVASHHRYVEKYEITKTHSNVKITELSRPKMLINHNHCSTCMVYIIQTPNQNAFENRINSNRRDNWNSCRNTKTIRHATARKSNSRAQRGKVAASCHIESKYRFSSLHTLALCRHSFVLVLPFSTFFCLISRCLSSTTREHFGDLLSSMTTDASHAIFILVDFLFK